MDSAFDVPDATDWLNTPLKDFADLENALHCQICKEFYDTPMITSCAHTFCSKCIRTSLSADGQCPACRSADQASKLRNNWAIQEAVSTFLAARTPALHIARSAQEEKAASNHQRKRKRPQISDEDDAQGAKSLGRTTRSKSRRLAAPQGSQSELVEIIDSDGDGDFEPEDDVKQQPDNGIVDCPLGCGKRMKIEAVDPHLDRCEEEREREKKSRSRTTVNGFAGLKGSTPSGARPLDRINELNYSLLKDSATTKKLNELGIPSWGSKQLMINRHREWVNLWNANCDSNSPRTKRELLQDLDVWERTQGGRAPHSNGLSSSIMRKDFDGAGWAKKNSDDFSRLIADAKRKKQYPAMLSEPSNNGKDLDAAQAHPTSAQLASAEVQSLQTSKTTGWPDPNSPAIDSTALSPPHGGDTGTQNSGRAFDPAVSNGLQRRVSTDAGTNQLISSTASSAPSSSSARIQPEPIKSETSMSSCDYPAVLPLQGPKKAPMYTLSAQDGGTQDELTKGKDRSPQ